MVFSSSSAILRVLRGDLFPPWLCRFFGLVFVTTFLADAVCRADDKPTRPNIVLILADDLGWSDLGCYGADLDETPNLDRLAGEGLRFSDAYAMPVCSPTRATLLTGKHAARLRITIWAEGSRGGPKDRKLLEGQSRHDLPHTETTLAKHLQAAGYLTALVGKWHLGDADHYPETHGFDVNIGGTRSARRTRTSGPIVDRAGSDGSFATCRISNSASRANI